MFCPNCGEKENNPVQFCRLCGANLGVVRDSLAESDNYTASAISAREEIARAAAERIKNGEWWQVGAIVPEVEKLFETPPERTLRRQRQAEEQRLSRLRGGTITASVGFGLILLFLFISMSDEKFLGLIGPSLLVFMIGLGIVINGLFFTIPKALKGANLSEETSAKPNSGLNLNPAPQNLFTPHQTPFQHLSVVENTTRNLAESEKRDTNKIKRQKSANE
ncbi:MAG: zinc ribbon domain-containing protein [Actinomycetota bacterium]